MNDDDDGDDDDDKKKKKKKSRSTQRVQTFVRRVHSESANLLEGHSVGCRYLHSMDDFQIVMETSSSQCKSLVKIFMKI